MTDTTGRVTGLFTSEVFSPAGCLQFDGFNGGYLSARTNGWVISENVTTPPQKTELWTLLGLSVTLRMGLSIKMNSNNPQRWGQLGKLLAGVSLGNTLPPSFVGISTLPSDLTNYETLWDGSQEDLKIVPDFQSSIDPRDYSVITKTFMFPQPIQLGWESNVQVGLIQLPWILGIGTNGPSVFLVVLKGAAYTLMYDSHSRKDWTS